MTVYLLLGLTFGFTAAVQPGLFTAYVISRALSDGWRRTLPVAFAPLISDGPVAVLTLLVLTNVPTGLLRWLRLAGAAFLFFLAASAARSWWRNDAGGRTRPASAERSVLKAAAVNVLNPGAYLGWSLVIGPLLLKGWSETPARGIALVVAFYAAMIGGLAGVVLLFGLAGRLGPRVNRALIGVSAVALAAFGLYQLWVGAGGGGR